METTQINLLRKIEQDIGYIKNEIIEIKQEIHDLTDFEINPEYIKKAIEIHKEPSIKIGSIEDLHVRYEK